PRGRRRGGGEHPARTGRRPCRGHRARQARPSAASAAAPPLTRPSPVRDWWGSVVVAVVVLVVAGRGAADHAVPRAVGVGVGALLDDLAALLHRAGHLHAEAALPATLGNALRGGVVHRARGGEVVPSAG